MKLKSNRGSDNLFHRSTSLAFNEVISCLRLHKSYAHQIYRRGGDSMTIAAIFPFHRVERGFHISSENLNSHPHRQLFQNGQ